MANISTYPIITPKSGDLIIGSETYDATDPNPTVGNPTRNFTVSSVVQTLPSTSITLPAYADDVSAGVAGLTAGKIYQTDGTGAAPLNIAGIVMVKQ